MLLEVLQVSFHSCLLSLLTSVFENLVICFSPFPTYILMLWLNQGIMHGKHMLYHRAVPQLMCVFSSLPCSLPHILHLVSKGWEKVDQASWLEAICLPSRLLINGEGESRGIASHSIKLALTSEASVSQLGNKKSLIISSVKSKHNSSHIRLFFFFFSPKEPSLL